MNSMTALSQWLSPQMLHALGWALLHFVWQGAALAALAAVAMAACRNARTRYCVGVAALALMLAVPVVAIAISAIAAHYLRWIGSFKGTSPGRWGISVCTFARRLRLAGGSMADRSGGVQPSLGRRLTAD
jgi:hypothetical protein